MDFKSDIVLKHEAWTNISRFCDKGLKIFSRNVDLFVIACAIGITCDEIIENSSDDDISLYTIGRNTLIENEDISRALTFLFTDAILTTKHVDFDIEIRMKLAFDDMFEIKNFSPTQFMIKFANYGITKLSEIDDNTDTTTMIEIINYVNELSQKSNYEYGDIEEVDDLEL